MKKQYKYFMSYAITDSNSHWKLLNNFHWLDFKIQDYADVQRVQKQVKEIALEIEPGIKGVTLLGFTLIDEVEE